MHLSRYKICFQDSVNIKNYIPSKSGAIFSYSDGRAVWSSILRSKNDYALIIKEGVVLPFDIENIVEDIIRKNELRWKNNRWAFIGNYGSEFISNRTFKCIRNMNSQTIPSMTGIPRIAQYLDANLLVVNVRKLRELNLKTYYSGNYDSVFFNLFLESYKKGLISFIDSNLYAYIKPKFDKKIFSYRLFENQEEKAYWKENFINHKFYGIRKTYDLDINYDYLRKKSVEKSDFYDLIKIAVSDNAIQNNSKIYIIIRTQFNHVNKILRLLNSINSLYNFVDNFRIEVIFSINNTVDSQDVIKTKLSKIKDSYEFKINSYFIEKEKHFPRVAAMLRPVLDIEDEDAFIWYIDADDFALPNAFDDLNPYLIKDSILIANSVVFDEVWNSNKEKNYPDKIKYLKTYNGSKYASIIAGDNCIPICSVIYSVSILKLIFRKYNLLGDYNEDYAMLLLAIKETDFVIQLPLTIAGISFHGKNTVLDKNRDHWQRSYVTFMREVVNSGLARSLFTEHIDNRKEKSANKGMDVVSKAIRILKKKGVVSFVKFSFLFIIKGRKYFRDGIDSLE